MLAHRVFEYFCSKIEKTSLHIILSKSEEAEEPWFQQICNIAILHLKMSKEGLFGIAKVVLKNENRSLLLAFECVSSHKISEKSNEQILWSFRIWIKVSLSYRALTEQTRKTTHLRISFCFLYIQVYIHNHQILQLFHYNNNS